MTPGAYRDRFPRLYGALIARHGGPNELQLAAGPPLAEGRDLLLCAPTASGKTEALLVPLAEALGATAGALGATAGARSKAGGGPARLFWICPTRALVNDLARRLTEPLAAVGVEVGRWTGDAHDGGRLHPLTILTPEALDARLHRAPDALDALGGLVLDELHMLDGGPRGDQLRLLVHTLRARARQAGRSLQVAAASATVPDPEGLSARYLERGCVVQAEGRRGLRARIVQGRDPGPLAGHLQDAAEAGFRKLLVFVDAREQVEELTAFLGCRPPFVDRVFAHHGSLARALRLRVEATFRQAPLALCVATSTMEVGLDIGDVDLVVLVGVPPDVASLVQRVGRGGRRGDRSLCLVAVEGALEEARARLFLEAQRRGDFLADAPVFHPSVLVQQALALAAGARGRVDPDALRRRLPPELQESHDPARLARLLARACERKLLLRVGEGPVCVPGPRGEALWRRGQGHANIAGGGTRAVVDRLTGDVVGQVRKDAEGRVSLGGRSWRVVLQERGRRVSAPASESDAGGFGGGPGPLMSEAQARALLERVGIPAPCRVVLPRGEALFHGLGSAAGALLGAILKRRGWSVLRAGPLAIAFEGAPFALLEPARAREEWPGPASVEASLASAHRALAGRLAPGPYHADLPVEEQLAFVRARCRASRVAALLDAGLPPQVPVADEALWEEAVWT